MPGGSFGGAPGDHRSRLLPREVRGGGGADRRHTGEHGEDADVLCAQAVGGTAEGGRNRDRLAMNTINKEREDLEALLPWHAAGTLNRCDSERVEKALASDRELARQLQLGREERPETIHLNESLGAPSARAMEKLFAAIDAEPARRAKVSFDLAGRLLRLLAGLF